jgi:hypothetical protein
MKYSGEVKCVKCKRKAYYTQSNTVRCGYHSEDGVRKSLPKNPCRFEMQREEERRKKEVIEERRVKTGECGDVKCAKRGIFNVPSIDGYISVFPNDRAKGSEFAMPALSPKRLGPVHHNQPGLPDSKTIENFHQFNKVFAQEIGPDGKPLPVFFERQREAYEDPIGRRHKFEKKDLPKDNPNIPKFSIFIWPDGTEHHYSYLMSRFFYCHWYEILAKQTDEYRKLEQHLANGYNLLIIGYDGREIIDLCKMYEDLSSPFGHELVLCSLLLIPDPKDYPWNVYFRKNREIYPPTIEPAEMSALQIPSEITPHH